MSKEHSWLRLVPWIKKNFPSEFPVSARRLPAGRVRDENGDQCDGDCNLIKKKFVIKISRDLTYALMFDALLHEYAHALTWSNRPPDPADPHVAEWGVAYARIYRAFWAWDYGRATLGKPAKKKSPRFLKGQKNFVGEPEG